MCTGIAIPVGDIPAAVLARAVVRDRVYARGTREEVQFHYWQVPTLLPVRLHGRLELVPWGSRDRRGALPVGGWVAEEFVGALAGARPERVVIPAALGFHKGTWFVINEGVLGVVLGTPAGPVVYMLTTASSNYYKNMTEQADVMPVLVDQVI